MNQVLLLDEIGPQTLPILAEAGIGVIEAKKGFGEDMVALRRFIEESFAPEELAAICLRSGTNLPASVLPFLRQKGISLIIRFGSGVDNISSKTDVFKVEAGKLGIVIENTPGQNANGVAELVKVFTLMLPRRIGWILQQQALGQTVNRADCRGTEVSGKTMGVIGLGWVGARVARKALGLGMTVLGYDTRPEIEVEGVRRVPLDVLLAQADFISVHVPLNPETENLIGTAQIATMASRPFLINCARAGIADLRAIEAGIESGRIAGYASDVDGPTDKVFNLPDTIVTPHIGASTEESEERCAIMGARQVVAWLRQGAIQNGINLADDAIAGCKNGRLLVIHWNRPGVIKSITDTVPGNIGVFSCKSHDGSNLACAMLGPDQQFDPQLVKQLAGLPNVIRVIAVK